MEDRFSTGHPTPTIDTTNNYNTFAVATNGGVNTYTFDRNLNTGDIKDYAILNGKTNMIYSYGSGSSFSQHAGGAYGSLSMTINTATLDVSFGVGTATGGDGDGDGDGYGEDGSISFNVNQTLSNYALAYIVWSWFSSSS